MGFEQYNAKRGRKSNINNVILQAGTFLRFSKKVRERLGVEIGQHFIPLYDSKNKKIALQRTSSSTVGAYKLSVAGNIWCKGMVKTMGIEKGKYVMSDSVSGDGTIILSFAENNKNGENNA